MAFVSGIRRVLGGGSSTASSILQSHYTSIRFNTTLTSPKLFISGTSPSLFSKLFFVWFPGILCGKCYKSESIFDLEILGHPLQTSFLIFILNSYISFLPPIFPAIKWEILVSSVSFSLVYHGSYFDIVYICVMIYIKKKVSQQLGDSLEGRDALCL